MRILKDAQPVELVSTYLGAHAWPPEYAEDRDGYVDFVINTVLPKIREEGLAEFVDVLRRKAFSVEQSRRIFNKAKELGFALRVHADEMHTLGVQN